MDQKMMGFVGAGQMCEAIVSGILACDIKPEQVIVSDVNEQRLELMAERYGVATAQSDAGGQGLAALAAHCDALVLAVKPQYANGVLAQLAPLLDERHLVISIIGGRTLGTLEGMLPKGRILRVMPNTPMQVGKGVAGIVPGSRATGADTEYTKGLFAMVGKSYVLPEAQLDALTGVSGCGPAFAYLFIEALADGGVEKGLPRQMALELAAQTLAGAAEMVLQTGSHPAALKDSVCSPGGGTIAGVHALESGGFRAAVMDAVAAGVERMAEIAREKE